MPSKKYMAGIPFTYRQIMGSVTVYFSKSKQCFIAQFRTANPAGGRALEYETRTTLQDREQIRDFLASKEGIKAQKALYAKYAEKMAEDFPAQIVQCSARQAYELLEATEEFQSCLAREISKGRKNTANQKDTLDRALLTKYLDRYGDTPLYKIDNAQKKMVTQDLAEEDPRYTAYQTPHAAFYSIESMEDLQTISCQNLIQYLQQHPRPQTGPRRGLSCGN